MSEKNFTQTAISADEKSTDTPLFERVTVPQGIRNTLTETDFGTYDVLVGSLGSEAQLRDNLKRNYYYVPAKYMSESNLPVRYIAIFQSKTLFGKNACIEYYGEVSQTKLLCRKDIKFPMRRDNGNESYYAFGIKEWKKLPIPISVSYEVVFEPKFTNMFLLQSCSQSYELFSIHSAEQYLLLHEIKRMYSEAVSASNPQFEAVCRIKNGKYIRAYGSYIEVTDENGEKLTNPPLMLSDFERDPKHFFRIIAEKTGL